ncbi:Protein of unknown function, partial [Gryllus bimaculatus]
RVLDRGDGAGGGGRRGHRHDHVEALPGEPHGAGDGPLETHPDDSEFEKFMEAIFGATYTTFDAFNETTKYYEDYIKPENYQDVVFKNKYHFEYTILNSNDNMGPEKPEVWVSFTEMGVCYSYNTAISPYLNPE